MPYNSETETFYQAPATVVDSTPDGDTVQEGFDDRLTPAMAGLYADLNLLKADGMISVGIPATTTARGIGRVATSADLVDGATINNGPAFIDAGLLRSNMLCNVRTVITVSGTFAAPVSGGYRIMCVGAGGAGGSQARTNAGPPCGGQAGGDTSFSTFATAKGGAGGGGGRSIGGSGGGAAGEVKTVLVFLTRDQSVNATIGAGGIISTIAGTAPTGIKPGKNAVSTQGNYSSGTGAQGAGSGTEGWFDFGEGGWAGMGGNGGRNNTGFGGGGGGASGGYGYAGNNLGGIGGDNGLDAADGNGSLLGNNGAKGGDGAIVIEYFDPAIAA